MTFALSHHRYVAHAQSCTTCWLLSSSYSILISLDLIVITKFTVITNVQQATLQVVKIMHWKPSESVNEITHFSHHCFQIVSWVVVFSKCCSAAVLRGAQLFLGRTFEQTGSKVVGDRSTCMATRFV